jgi:hypothetical protein
MEEDEDVDENKCMWHVKKENALDARRGGTNAGLM